MILNCTPQRGLALLDSLWMMRFPDGLVAELYCDGLALLDLDGLGRIIQQIARLGAGLLDDQSWS